MDETPAPHRGGTAQQAPIRTNAGAAPLTVFFPTFDPHHAAGGAQVKLCVIDSWVVCEASGSISASVAQCLRELLRDTFSEGIVLDLRKAALMDYVCLDTVSRIHRLSRSMGGSLRLVGPPVSAHYPGWTAQLAELPPMFATLEEALEEALAEHQPDCGRRATQTRQ